MGRFKRFLFAVLLVGVLPCHGQFYGSIGLSIPDNNLSNIAGDGISIGSKYSHQLGQRFRLIGSVSYTSFQSEHYPSSVPAGVPPSVDYKVKMLPLLFGVSFHPFNGKFSKKLFISGKAGGQWIFFNLDQIDFQESVHYKSKELDFSYGYEGGMDLNVFQFVIANTFVSPRNPGIVQKVSYLTIALNFKIGRKTMIVKKE